MDKILSQEEIDELMGSIVSGEVDTAPKDEAPGGIKGTISFEPGTHYTRANARHGNGHRPFLPRAITRVGRHIAREDGIQRGRHFRS